MDLSRSEEGALHSLIRRLRVEGQVEVLEDLLGSVVDRKLRQSLVTPRYPGSAGLATPGLLLSGLGLRDQALLERVHDAVDPALVPRAPVLLEPAPEQLMKPLQRKRSTEPLYPTAARFR